VTIAVCAVGVVAGIRAVRRYPLPGLVVAFVSFYAGVAAWILG